MSSLHTPKRISPDEAQALWREYKAGGDVRVRNRLVMSLTPLVRYIVSRKVRELPARCGTEDFISCGLEALIAAIERYDPSKGATLEQFAWTRVHGAVLDELRRQDWAPRSLRRWERDMARARAQFTARTGRPPGDGELADALGLSVEELRTKQDEVALSDVTSLNMVVGAEDDTSLERIDTLADPDGRMDPEEATAIREAKGKFRSAFEALPRREREVAVMLYVKNMTLREIGEVLGVSESRVCQLHAGLRRTLKRELAGHAALFGAVG